MTLYTPAYLKNKLTEELDALYVDVQDDSDGCGAKFSCTIVSQKFEGKPTIQRHRLVNAVLKDELKTIHAFSQKTLTPEQWKQQVRTLEVSAPGKVILHGEHSVVYGKLAIAASIDLRTRLSLTANNCDALKLTFQAIDLSVEISPSQLIAHVLDNGKLPLATETGYNFAKPAELPYDVLVERIRSFISDEQRSLPTDPSRRNALIACLYLYVGMLAPCEIEREGLDISIRTDLTVGAGMGSSASFAVCIAAGFVSYLKCKLRTEAPSVYCRALLECTDAQQYTSREKSLISDWALQAERVMHGRPSGIDNSVCTFGSLVQYRKGEQPEPLNWNCPLEGFLIDTTVPKNTKTQVEKVAQLRASHPAIVEKILQAMDATSESAIACLSRLTSIAALENAGEEYNTLNTLFDINQSLLRSLGVSHAAIDNICSILEKFELHGKITGAGGGGYVLCLVPFVFDKHKLHLVTQELRDAGYITLKLLKLGCTGVQCDYGHF